MKNQAWPLVGLLLSHGGLRLVFWSEQVGAAVWIAESGSQNDDECDIMGTLGEGRDRREDE